MDLPSHPCPRLKSLHVFIALLFEPYISFDNVLGV
jgi:hypothetical protein